MSEFDPTLFAVDPTDPWPAPSRRWLRAEYLLCHGRRPTRGRDDPLGWEVWRFRRGLARCRGEADRARLTGRFPHLAAAHDLYTSAGTLKRAALEARVLAGEGDAAVGARMGMAADVIATYVGVFFAVRPRLAYPHYVLDVVLGGRARYPPDPDDHGLLLRLFGHAMGNQYVDVLLDYFKEPLVLPESLEGLDEASLRRLLGKLRTRLLLLAVTTPAGGLGPQEWLGLQGALAAAPEPPAAGTNGGASTLTTLRAALEAAATLAEAAARGGPRAA
jgi:hypothetical protein